MPPPATHVAPLLLLLFVRLQPSSACIICPGPRCGDPCYIPGGSAGVNKSSCCGDMRPPRPGAHTVCNSSNPMARGSVCVASGTPPPPPPSPRPCTPERLHNNIELPCPWPPRRPFQASATPGLIEPPSPRYLAKPPAVRDISIGRSLFVDEFLVDEVGSDGVTRTFFAAEYVKENPVITFDKQWEKIGSTYARPFSGGVYWHGASHMYRLYYGCGDSVSDDSNLALCLATSEDGIRWQKGVQPVVPNTNIVVATPLRSNNVWDMGPNVADTSRRYVLSDTNGPEAPGRSYWLWGSADGVHWKALHNNTGPTSDRGTAYWDPFRRRFVFSIKGYESEPNKQFGRHRMYWETATADPFGPNVHWDIADPVLWAAADSLDQSGVTGNDAHAELYTLDVSPYESLSVAFYTILRGKKVILKGNDHHPEYDSIYLGYSRDGGYSISRPPADQPANGVGFELKKGKRFPFAGMTPNQQAGTTVGSDAWNFASIQSVTGSPVLAPDNDTLLFFFGGQRGFSVSCVGPGSQTGVATLRRDGFAAMKTGSRNGTLLTQPLRFNSGRPELFVNFVGSVAVEVLDGVTKESLLGRSEVVTGDSTIAQMVWPGKTNPLQPYAGKRSLRFLFEMGAETQLYSFWTAMDSCGASNGFLGGGGPGAPDGIDSHGRCSI